MAGNNKIELRKLKDSFFYDHGDLKEIMKKEENKVRGYGYISCLIEKHHFAIPLRSSITHPYSFVVSTPSEAKGGHQGLDYTKAIIIDPSYLGSTFVIPNNQFGRIYRNQEKIIADFSEYVRIYKEFISTGVLPVEYKNAYSFTTLVNYHEELGLLVKSH